MAKSSVRIAMWSGPRNISTALMRSWDSRPDTYVCDEPLYAHYLASTNAIHPGREHIIKDGETDWRKVVRWLTGPVPPSKQIFYQKHMAHHLLPGISGAWLAELTNALLIRDPEEMLISFAGVIPNPTIDDTGLPQQIELIRQIEELTGTVPVVIDARDVLESPRVMLERLCRALGVPFREEMLKWAPGKRSTDGPWAPYWYANVETSTGFLPYHPPTKTLPDHLKELERRCRVLYEELYRRRLTT